jgi:hypothetical protein
LKQFFCVIVALAASAALLFLVSAPVNESHGEESAETETQSAALAGETAHGTESPVSSAH